MVISRLKKKIPKAADVKIIEAAQIIERVAVSEAVKVRTDKPGFVQINLHVKPGARVSRVAEITDNHIGLQISAPPRDGEANEEVIKYLAEVFELKERQVQLISGQKSRDKVVLVERDNDDSDLLQSVMKALLDNQ